jgi:hypothetical protein
VILGGFSSNSILYCSHFGADYIVEQEQRQVTRVWQATTHSWDGTGTGDSSHLARQRQVDDRDRNCINGLCFPTQRIHLVPSLLYFSFPPEPH